MELIIIIAVAAVVAWFVLKCVGDLLVLVCCLLELAVLVAVAILDAAAIAVSWTARRICRR